VNTQITDRPVQLPISDDIVLTPRPGLNEVFFAVTNDSSLLSKSTQTTEFSFSYSREAMSAESGNLFFGARANIYLKQLSRVSVRTVRRHPGCGLPDRRGCGSRPGSSLGRRQLPARRAGDQYQ
jgi:hypothetical protein